MRLGVQSEAGYGKKEGSRLLTKLDLAEEAMEVSSFNCRSETDSMFSLEEHLNTLAEKLCGLKFNKRAENKQLLYQDIANFVRNFARFQFDPDLLIKKKIGQYLSILYNLLLEINDHECEAYSLLLPSLSSLITKVKKQLLHSVSISLTQYKSGTASQQTQSSATTTTA
jgi:hypothetical protein